MSSTSLIRWLPEASPQHALVAAVAIAALALAGDITVITIYLGSNAPAQVLALIAIAASLTRIARSLVTMRHAAAMHHAMSPLVVQHAVHQPVMMAR